MSCDENHCITCSDEGVSMRVVEARDGIAVCEGGLEVMTDLVGEVGAGDELLVHAGVAIASLTSEAKSETRITESPEEFR